MLTEADIRELTKPSLWRDWLDSDDPRKFEEFRIDWELKISKIRKGALAKLTNQERRVLGV